MDCRRVAYSVCDNTQCTCWVVQHLHSPAYGLWVPRCNGISKCDDRTPNLPCNNGRLSITSSALLQGRTPCPIPWWKLSDGLRLLLPNHPHLLHLWKKDPGIQSNKGIWHPAQRLVAQLFRLSFYWAIQASYSTHYGHSSWCLSVAVILLRSKVHALPQ